MNGKVAMRGPRSATRGLLAGMLGLIPGCSSPPDPAVPEAVSQAEAVVSSSQSEAVSPSAAAATELPPRIVSWGLVEEWSRPLAIMETVFWEPEDTASLRKLIRETDAVRDQRVLEIGTGSGLIALCCLRAGAARVAATDINPIAIRCAAYNARQLGLEEHLQLQQVSRDAPEAFSVVEPDERFDLIISNPPWEDQTPGRIAEFALYDRNFSLLRSLLAGLRDHLTPRGRAWLAYGNVTAIRTLLVEAPRQGLESRVLDDRGLDALPENFLPGMLIELVPVSTDASPSAAPQPSPTHIIEK